MADRLVKQDDMKLNLDEINIPDLGMLSYIFIDFNMLTNIQLYSSRCNDK